MGERTLYHGTNEEVAASDEDIFALVDNRFPEVSGNLTNDREFANKWALRRANGQVKKERVMEFKLPDDEVDDLGKIAGYEAHGYASRERVDPDDVPEEYLLRKGLSGDDLRALDPTKVYVTRVPRLKVAKIHRLDE